MNRPSQLRRELRRALNRFLNYFATFVVNYNECPILCRIEIVHDKVHQLVSFEVVHDKVHAIVAPKNSVPGPNAAQNGGEGSP